MNKSSTASLRSGNSIHQRVGKKQLSQKHHNRRPNGRFVTPLYYIMIGFAITSLLQFTTHRPLLLPLIATNLPLSTSAHHHTSNNIQTCQTSNRSSSSSTSTSTEQECRDNTPSSPKQPTTLYRRAVHLIHRHGDRTPITPLKNEDHWTSQLIPNTTLNDIAKYTTFISPNNTENKHNANGRGPFGKLTSLGLQQMIDLGTKLRHQLVGKHDNYNKPIIDEYGRTFYPHLFLDNKLHPTSIHVRSTNFVRTIQSVQGLLQGLIPMENIVHNTTTTTQSNITIDIRHTNWMIPDPQPRNTPEQIQLELELSQQPHLIEKEKELLPFAIAMTKALQPLLADDARDADFGVPQQDLDSNNNNDIKPLSWNQLAEITKCLAVRNLLPEGITKEDQERISQHAAYRWYESFRHPHLSYYAMSTMTQTIVKSLLHHQNETTPAAEDVTTTTDINISKNSKLNIWSAHDSTLICLMCAFRLEQPAIWPEYASYLLIELLEDPTHLQQQMWVRFSLNGQILRTMWDPMHPKEMMPVNELWDHLIAQNPKGDEQ